MEKEEIKIYRLNWKNLIAGLICLAMTFLYIILSVFYGKEISMTLFICVVLFGIGGLMLLYYTVRARLHPYLIITDKGITICKSMVHKDDQTYEIDFAEIDHIELEPFSIFHPFERELCIYNKTVQYEQTAFKSSLLWRIIEKLFSSGPDTYISTSGINMDKQELNELLCERLYHAR